MPRRTSSVGSLVTNSSRWAMSLGVRPLLVFCNHGSTGFKARLIRGRCLCRSSDKVIVFPAKLSIRSGEPPAEGAVAFFSTCFLGVGRFHALHPTFGGFFRIYCSCRPRQLLGTSPNRCISSSLYTSAFSAGVLPFLRPRRPFGVAQWGFRKGPYPRACSAAIAASRSLNGIARSPMVWVCSWPLPRIRTRSPGSACRMAA